MRNVSHDFPFTNFIGFCNTNILIHDCCNLTIIYFKSTICFQFQQNPSFEYSTHVSYLEIYNEFGYDLLDPRHEASKLEDLP